MIVSHDKTSKAFASTILFPGQGPRPTLICASLHHPVQLSLPARARASSPSSATATTLANRTGTSGPTAGFCCDLDGTARQLACAAEHLSQATLTPKFVSPKQRASAASTTGSLSISPRFKPTSPVRKVKAPRSRRRSKGICQREMDLMVGP